MSAEFYLISVISIAFQIYTWLIVVRALLSFIHFRSYHPVLRFIYEATEPVLSVFRRLLPRTGTFDFSPFLVVLFLEIARQLVISLFAFLLAVGR